MSLSRQVTVYDIKTPLVFKIIENMNIQIFILYNGKKKFIQGDTFQMNKILAFAFLSSLFFLSLYGCNDLPPANQQYTIGIVNLTPKLADVVTGFQQRLTKYGNQEGIELTFKYRGPMQKNEQIEKEINEFIAQKVDLIFVTTTVGAKTAKQLTAGINIPVVFAPVVYPVHSKLVDSIARPGGNLTGIKVGGNIEKALGWLVALAPQTNNIYVPFMANEKPPLQTLAALKTAATKLNITIVEKRIGSTEDLPAALTSIPEQVNALWLLNSPTLASNTEKFVAAAIEHKLPLGSAISQYKHGILVTYGQCQLRTGEQSARLAHMILSGAEPATLPVETADFFLGLNLKTAAAIDLEVPVHIIKQADFVAR